MMKQFQKSRRWAGAQAIKVRNKVYLLVMHVCCYNHPSIKCSKAAHLKSSEHTEWLARFRFLEERNPAVALDADAPLEEDKELYKELSSCHKAIPAAMAAQKCSSSSSCPRLCCCHRGAWNTRRRRRVYIITCFKSINMPNNPLCLSIVVSHSKNLWRHPCKFDGMWTELEWYRMNTTRGNTSHIDVMQWGPISPVWRSGPMPFWNGRKHL